MSIPDWICLDCKTVFAPIIKDDEVSFNCPSCRSPKTIAKRLGVLNAKSNGNSLDKGG